MFMDAVLDALMTEEQKKVFEQERSTVFTYTFGTKARFKVNAFYQKGHPAASLRFIEPHMKTIRDLGLPAVVENFARAEKGLIVVSGTFGSGRSSTVAALVDTINRDRVAHILTIEQPIEHLFVNTKSIVEQREVGKDTKSFEDALENSFQEDVDVVMISELSTPAVIALALKVAESGRLVVSSMNADSAVRTIERIVTAFGQDEQEQVRNQLAAVLTGVVHQRLLPRTGGGSAVVVEVLTATQPIRSVIRDGAIYQIATILQTSREEGMIPLDRSLADRVKAGEILEQEAMAAANDKNVLKNMLRGTIV